MKKLSKIHIKGTIFISTNLLTLILANKTSNATPISGFSKPSTLSLLGEVIRNPSNSFIQRLSNGNLKATFLISGRRGVAKNNYNVKGGATVGVKKTPNSNYEALHGTPYQKKFTSEGVAFKILTTSSRGLHKEIHISEENGNIVVNSKKGEGTPNYIVKSTTLDFGDGAATSSQSSTPSEPRIISKRLSNYNEKEGKFIVEQINIFDPLSLRLTSSTTKNNLTGETTSSTGDEQQTTTTPREIFLKPSITKVLSETIKNPQTAPITKTPDGKIHATFLHFGKYSSSINNVIIRNKSIVTVRKDWNQHFEEIKRTKNKINLESTGVEFKVYTRSKIWI